MAKFILDALLDLPLNEIRTNCNQMIVCSSQPTDRATALSSALASVSMTSTDFTVQNGLVSGRRITVAAKSGVSISASGNGNHIALIDGTRLLAVTTCDLQGLNTGGTVDIPSFNMTLPDPA